MTRTDRIQARALLLAALFLVTYAVALSLSPAARLNAPSTPLLWQHYFALLAWSALFFAAHHQSARYLPYRDPLLLPIGALLCGWGNLTIYRLYPSFGFRQTLWLLLAGALLILAMQPRLANLPQWLRRYKYLWFTSGLLLTALTLLFGSNPMGFGARLWLGCCGIYWQPSEALKLLLLIYLAAYLAERIPAAIPNQPAHTHLLPLLIPTLLVTGIALLILIAQRDLGAATLLIFLYTTLVYLATAQKRILFFSAFSIGAAALLGYQIFAIVQTRIQIWLNPWRDPSGSAYQIVQALLAAANGGLFGRGPGMGSPAFVPVPHSDFIFISIIEEFGLLGGLGLLLLLALLLNRALRIALQAPTTYNRLLAFGIAALLGGQSLLIIGGNLRLLPLTGVTLPFVSYGGSSLLAAFFCLLLLMRLSNTDQQPAPLPHPAIPQQFATLLYSGILACALALGYWSLTRAPDLLTRTDNPRRALTDRLVPRGNLYDRSGNPLHTTIGSPGEYTRTYHYPPLSPVTGYNQAFLGQNGIEAALDPYLRGVRGQSALLIWQHHLLYGQPPPGLDIRLTLDLNLQRAADELLDGHQGALVLLNANTGEILVMASHPNFDPNQLKETIGLLAQDDRALLLNRAAQGQYHAGTAVGPLLMGVLLAQNVALPPLPRELTTDSNCLLRPQEQNWAAYLQAACPTLLQAFAALNITPADLEAFGLYRAPVLHLAVAPATPVSAKPLPQAEIRVSPLQMALAAAALSNNGSLPAPRIALSLNIPAQGWVTFSPLDAPRQALPEYAANNAARALAVQNMPLWGAPGIPVDNTSPVWYVAGSLPEQETMPLALAIVLEENDPELARQIGITLLLRTLSLPVPAP